MKLKLTFLFILLFFSEIAAQNDEWIYKSYGLLKYKYPKNWKELQYLDIDGKKSYGSINFENKNVSQFSVIEMFNDTENVDAHNITDEEIKNLVLHIFSNDSKFEYSKSTTIAGLNAKYIKASVVGKNLSLSSINYLVCVKNKIILIQGIFSSEYENEYLPILEEILQSITFK